MIAIATLLCFLSSIISRPTMGFGFVIDHYISTVLNEPSSALHPNLLASTTAAIPNPLAPVFEKYISTLTAFPLPTKMLTGAALATAGDAIAQKREDNEYDPSRGASFAAFDMIYRAAQHWLFPIIVELCRGQHLFSIRCGTAIGSVDAYCYGEITCKSAHHRAISLLSRLFHFYRLHARAEFWTGNG